MIIKDYALLTFINKLLQNKAIKNCAFATCDGCSDGWTRKLHIFADQKGCDLSITVKVGSVPNEKLKVNMDWFLKCCSITGLF